MKSINPDDFRVVKEIKLSKIPTNLNVDASDEEKEEELLNIQKKLSKRQDKMYAHNRNSISVAVCLNKVKPSNLCLSVI